MRSIYKIIHNLRHPKAPRVLSTVISGFVREIISKFNRVLHVFRRRKANSIIPVDEDLNLNVLHYIEYKEEDYEASTPPNPVDPEQQTADSKQVEVNLTDPDTPALEDEHDDSIFCELCNKNGDHDSESCPNDPTSGLKYCTICRHLYPAFCRKPEEHSNRVEDYKYCGHCYLIGDHKTAMCLNKRKRTVLVCSVCEELYPCKNPEEHGNKSIEVANLCSHCFKWGHLPQECTDENWDPNLAW